jgi:hypothetical protein
LAVFAAAQRLNPLRFQSLVHLDSLSNVDFSMVRFAQPPDIQRFGVIVVMCLDFDLVAHLARFFLKHPGSHPGGYLVLWAWSVTPVSVVLPVLFDLCRTICLVVFSVAFFAFANATISHPRVPVKFGEGF